MTSIRGSAQAVSPIFIFKVKAQMVEQDGFIIFLIVLGLRKGWQGRGCGAMIFSWWNTCLWRAGFRRRGSAALPLIGRDALPRIRDFGQSEQGDVP